MSVSEFSSRGPTLEELRGAARTLSEILVPAPLVPFRDRRGGDADIWLKSEVQQVVGSFKIRGIFHAVARLSAEQRAGGLETVSAGNTAQALAWVGRHFGVEARCLMPEHAPQAKIEAVRRFGGTAVLVPVAEVFRYLREHAWEGGPRAFIHPWIDREVWIGHGTLGLEIHRDLPAVETVYIPVGGGGLLAGVGAALRALSNRVRIVAVEPEGCPALHAAREQGRPVEVACETLCDGVAVPYITEEMFPVLSGLVDEVELVSEREVRDALRRLALDNGIVAEGAGALALAAALRTPPDERGTSVCLVTGSSIDGEQLASILTEDEPG